MRVRMLMLAAPIAVLAVSSAEAQKPGGLQVRAGGTVMISCIRAGNVFYSTEPDYTGIVGCLLEGAPNLAPGAYEVRVEGEGVVTELRRGLLVTPGNTTIVHVGMKEGKGVHIVEYATGPLPREEITTRLIGLEAAVAKLTTAISEMRTTLAAKKP